MEIRKQKGKKVGNNIPLAEFVLRMITDKPNFMITDCKTQKDMRNESLKEVALRILAAGKYTLYEIASLAKPPKESNRHEMR